MCLGIGLPGLKIARLSNEIGTTGANHMVFKKSAIAAFAVAGCLLTSSDAQQPTDPAKKSAETKAADQPNLPKPLPHPETRSLTEENGRPIGDNNNSRTAGPDGPVLLDDFSLLQKLARFDRERIPERVVHARGAGAQGEFVSYGDFSAHTRAKLFSAKGKTTPVFMRFSTVIHPRGSAEQMRDPRGFSIKFYTEEGNWDMVGNNIPIFFIRDAIKFPDLIHSLKPSPITNQQEPDRIFDFLSHQPESTHMITFLWSDRGTPRSYREQEGFGVHAFKWVNAKGEVVYVKFNWRSMQGIKTNTQEEADLAAGINASGLTKDLYDHIANKDYPSWELGVQMLTPTELAKLDFNGLDDTKIWPGVPEIKVGKLTLNRVPDNFFQFTEQSAFSPGVMVPGIEASEDKMLQGRLFSYSDTQRYRLGVNYLFLPVNKAYNTVVDNDGQDGKMNFGVTQSDVNYAPSRKTGGRGDNPKYDRPSTPLSGATVSQPIKKQQNFKQAGEQYLAFDESQRTNLIKNLSGDLNRVVDPEVKAIIVSFCYRANKDYGTRLAKATNVKMADVERIIAADKDE